MAILFIRHRQALTFKSIALFLFISISACGQAPSARSPVPSSLPVTMLPLFDQPIAGDTPPYVSVPNCPQDTQTAIQRKHLPPDLIRSCTEERVSIDGDDGGTLVRIIHGPASDCPAGCIYQAYVGLFTAKDTQLIDLPPKDAQGIEAGLWGHPPLNIWRTGSCDADVRIHGRVSVGQRVGQYGWLMEFDELSCPNAYAIGSVFIYLDAQGREIWDLSQLQTINKPPVRSPATPGPGYPTVMPAVP